MNAQILADAARIVGLLGALSGLLGGCGEQAPPPLEGSPAGPYRLILTLDPPRPTTDHDTDLAFRLIHSGNGQPVTDLQIVHERSLHTFIVARDFSSFAHLHQDDFVPVTAPERMDGRQHFPYRFPAQGSYRIVSEFVHRDRSWSKRFDVQVGPGAALRAAAPDFARERQVGPYHAVMSTSPARPVAGHETELVFELSRDGRPVTDLALWLGAEAHVAIWRSDGEFFGHTHSYTPEMARMMATMQGHRMDAAHSAAMMLKMMAAPPRLVYPGPVIPVRHVFPSAGTYHLFVQCAPGGASLVLPFVVAVVADDGQADTRLQSIVEVSAR